jgi:hypothetical protein
MGSEQEGAVVEHEEEREERGPMKISNPPEIDSDAQYLRAEPTEPSKTIDVIAAKAGDAGAVDDAAQSAEDISTDSLEVPDISGPGNGDGAHGSSLRRSCVGCTQARKKVGFEYSAGAVLSISCLMPLLSAGHSASWKYLPNSAKWKRSMKSPANEHVSAVSVSGSSAR